MHNQLFEVSLVIVIATIVAGLMHVLRQPLIIGHIITGLVVGPFGFGLIKSTDTLEVFSGIGIVLLLFIVGLGLNPRVIREVGKTAVITGVGQVLFTTVLGTIIALGLGFSLVSSLFIALAISFSSTIIIMKLLSDKREINQLYGKISVGFLLIQDIIATFTLVFVAALAQGKPLAEVVTPVALKLILACLLIALIARFILPRLSTFVSRSSEFLFLFALAYGLGIAMLFQVIGLSVEIGALIAGVSLATAPYALEMGSKLKPLRDFFIVVFFILLGAQMKLDSMASIAVPAMVFSTLVLIGNPIIVMVLMRFLGYTKKTNFKAGLAVAQISEFSLILIVLAVKTGQLPEEISSMMTLIALITIAASTYLIHFADQLHDWLERPLGLFEKESARQPRMKKETYDVILFGYHRAGRQFIEQFQKMKLNYIVVDYDPDVINFLTDEGLPARFGDASDLELLSELHLESARMIVSVISDDEINKLIVEQVPARKRNIVIVTSDDIESAMAMYDMGATYVMMPHYIGSVHTNNLISRNGFDLSLFLKEQIKHKQYLLKSRGLND
ncbi:cation:proton antiporter [Candidatus Saccharibacteria bacterium]|nr:cation:proton antiporter [Candidatus Saccharibacteria bacterium]